LDTHNLRALGKLETAYRLAKSVKHTTKLAKIHDYVATCAITGGSRHWWNTWCETVANNRANRKLATADAVSAYHVQCLA
jgi:hypothetical protein